MTTPEGKAALAAVHYVRDLFRNAARLLLAGDSPLSERGWVPHSAAWKPTFADGSLSSPDRLLPHWIIRQYYAEGRTETKQELLTLAVIPHDPIDNRIEEPVCLASRARPLNLLGQRPYWVPLVQLRCKDGIGSFGEVRRVRREDLEPDPARLADFDEVVRGGEILSIVVPLLPITDDEALERSVIGPLSRAEYSAGA